MIRNLRVVATTATAAVLTLTGLGLSTGQATAARPGHTRHGTPASSARALPRVVVDPPVLKGPGPVRDLVTTPPYPTSQTFLLHSNPTATRKIFLDFDGHTTTGTQWNLDYRRPTIVTPPFSLDASSSLSTLEHAYIQSVWLHLREDFAPFNVDVTTQDPGVGALRYDYSGDTGYGERIVIGADAGNWFAQPGTGVAYVGSSRVLSRTYDTPAFVFPERLGTGLSDSTLSQVAGHEAGHSAGLDHDGQSSSCNYNNCEYYFGANGWVPIMGGPVTSATVTQWSKGEYPRAKTSPRQTDTDDLRVLQGYLGGYRADDYEGGLTATTPVGAGSRYYGVISQTDEVDSFKFSLTTRRTLTITVTNDAGPVDPNLNAGLTLTTSTGAVLATSTPSDSMGASMRVTLSPGTYFANVRGVGDPAVGYTSYDSLGYYRIGLDWS